MPSSSTARPAGRTTPTTTEASPTGRLAPGGLGIADATPRPPLCAPYSRAVSVMPVIVWCLSSS